MKPAAGPRCRPPTEDVPRWREGTKPAAAAVAPDMAAGEARASTEPTGEARHGRRGRPPAPDRRRSASSPGTARSSEGCGGGVEYEAPRWRCPTRLCATVYRRRTAPSRVAPRTNPSSTRSKLRPWRRSPLPPGDLDGAAADARVDHGEEAPGGGLSASEAAVRKEPPRKSGRR